jgi:hypothetical protein
VSIPSRAAGALLFFLSLSAADLDLTHARLILPKPLAPRESKAAAMFVDEVEKRSRTLLSTEPGAGPAITVISSSGPAEGYTLRTTADSVTISANDQRGFLFGLGRLLREMRMTRDHISIPIGLSIVTAPKYPLRGHQLGYRPKTNSYDGWTVALWEQYIRDLAVFGTNAVELIPPRSDDAADSPHFPLPPLRMMTEMSKLLDDYGLDCWIWYPAMDKDYTDPATVEAAIKEWSEVFRALPRVDAVFVPGGDPGHTRPKVLLALLEKQTRALHQFHPEARMWVSPQGFTQEWLDEFLAILKDDQPAWLAGIVYGPQIRISLPALRKQVPSRYPIRHYPDITHSRQCQYPVPDWDLAYAVTEGREVINPRPSDQANIFGLLQPYTNGFITYSEGCNDDINKIVWSALGWDPDANLDEVLRQYSRYFISPDYENSFSKALLALERNWRGPLAGNNGVETTLDRLAGIERAATPGMLLNWRFQQALYRAYYDAYVRHRLLYETKLEQSALDRLAAGAMDDAEKILDQPFTDPLRARVFELAEALFQSIRMQLSVERYKAISVDRGATLDTLDYPLNNRAWLKQRFTEIRALSDADARASAIQQILHWTEPGPGGFYDDLGDPSRQPHLVRGAGAASDPAFLESSLTGFGPRAPYRTSVWTHAESLNDAPLRMHYAGLGPSARYKLRVTYAGDSPRQKMRLVANGSIEIHDYIDKPVPYRPIEFDLSAETTRSGTLDLEWTRQPGQGGNGRGCQVAEVWLIKTK